MESFGSFGLLAAVVAVTKFGPTLLLFAASVGLFLLGSRGEGQGWRPIAASGGLMALNQLLGVYPTVSIMLHRGSAAEIGQMMMAFSVVHTILALAAMALLLLGLWQLQQRTNSPGTTSTPK